MNVTTANRIPLKVWATDLEENAAAQADHLANLPFAFRHVAIMSDCHLGYGMPIGGVLATVGVVICNAVGVDIACGVRAWPVKTGRESIMAVRQQVMNQVQRDIPTGFEHHRVQQEDWDSEVTELFNDTQGVVDREYEKSLYQLGTLGGGNHFIELSVVPVVPRSAPPPASACRKRCWTPLTPSPSATV